jgi:hypothetical protein
MALFSFSIFKSQFCSDCVCGCPWPNGRSFNLLVLLFLLVLLNLLKITPTDQPTAGVTLRTRDMMAATLVRGVVRAALSPRYKSADGTHTRCCITIIIINENKISKGKYLSAVCAVKKTYLSTIRELLLLFFI